MFTTILLLGTLGAQAVLAAPNLAARWENTNLYGRQNGLNGTNGTSMNGTSTNGTSTNSTSGLSTGDTQVLQFALYLEYLENAFYSQGLSLFNDSAFEDAGFNSNVRDRFVEIWGHETTHVTLLEGILGPDAPQPCNYTFPFSDPQSFAAISQFLEEGGVAAYLGAISLLENKVVQTTAGQIVTVEARQASFVASDVLGRSPFSGPFDTALNASSVFSVAAQFISNCPSTNPPLNVVPLPNLSINPPNATINQTVFVALTGQADFIPENIPIVNGSFVSAQSNGTDLFLAYYNGLNVTYSPLNAADNTTTIPDGLSGITYVALVAGNDTQPTIDNVLTGLVILNIPVPANATNTSGPATTTTSSGPTATSTATMTTPSSSSFTSIPSASFFPTASLTSSIIPTFSTDTVSATPSTV